MRAGISGDREESEVGGQWYPELEPSSLLRIVLRAPLLIVGRDVEDLDPLNCRVAVDREGAIRVVAKHKAAQQFGLFFGFVYALGGWAIIALLTQYDLPYLAYPLATGFALIAPFAALVSKTTVLPAELRLPRSPVIVIADAVIVVLAATDSIPL